MPQMCSTRRDDRRDYKSSNTCETRCTTKTLTPKDTILTQETKQMSSNLLVSLFCVATPMKNELFCAAAPLKKWNLLSKRGIRQLAEACHGRSLAAASRPRSIKLQHSFLGLCLAPAFRAQGCVLCARRRTLMHTT